MVTVGDKNYVPPAEEYCHGIPGLTSRVICPDGY